jgi:TctA family transporter
MKKSERKGRRSFDTAIEYGTVAMVAREKTRTAKAAVRATRSGRCCGILPHNGPGKRCLLSHLYVNFPALYRKRGR